MSFGLVLLATILLVVGLLSEDSINLIYMSIGASATAAVVLFLAFRMARPKTATGSERPEPLPEELSPTEEPSPTEVVNAPASAVPATPAAPPTAAEPTVAPAAAEDSWAATDWEMEEEVVDFPIADYDELTVAEILPLLPQLYSDELDVVYEREQNGKARSTILSELDKLKETGTEADALEQGVEEEPTPAAAPPPATVPAASTTSLLGDEEDEDAAFFPIADYDDLSVSQIVPLLPQLEMDELRDVREREVAGANRAALIDEIDRYLRGELQAFRWEDEEEAGEPTPAIDPEVERLPIDNYPQLVVSEVLPRLDGLTPAQLEQVLEFEKARDNRFAIVAEIEHRLERAAPATPARERPAQKRAARKAPARKAPARKAPARKAAAGKKAASKKTAAKKAAGKKAASKKTAAKKAGTKKAAKRAKKAAASAFPIPNYDELNVADIRPLLSDLTDAQLRQVREREESGAGRKTILNEVDRRLS